MTQVPDVNGSNDSSSIYVGVGFLPNGQTTGTSLADQVFANNISVDTVSGGTVETAKEVQNSQNEADVSAVKFQSGVQDSIDALIATLQSATTSNINVISNVLDSAIHNAGIPNLTAITNQYNADSSLVDQSTTLTTQYNAYVTDTSSISSAISSDQGTINSGFSSVSSVSSQLTSYLNQYISDFNAGNYSNAETDISNILSYYTTNVSNVYTNVSSAVSNYNSTVQSFYSNNDNDFSDYTEQAWNQLQTEINARNTPSLQQYYGSVQPLPTFKPLVTNLSTTLFSPPAASDYGFPSSVSASTGTNIISILVNSMIYQAGTFQSSLSPIYTQSNANTATVVNVQPLTVPNPMPSFATYFQSVITNLCTYLNSATFQTLLGLTGVQDNGATQALATTLLNVQSAQPSILLSNPSGGAVTGATLSTVSNSSFLEAYAQALAQELAQQVESGTAFESSVGIRPNNAESPDSNALPDGITAGSNSALTNPPSDPGTSSAGGILANLPALATDLSALLGQYSILAAIQVLQSDNTLSSQDTETANAEFLTSVSNFLSNRSSSDLDNRITALLQAQGVTLTANQLQAINNTTTQFTTALQGIIANTVSGQSNLATSTLAAQIASNYTETTFQSTQESSLNQQQQLQAEQNSQQQLQILLQNLPQQAFLSGPAALAQQAVSNGGAGPNGALGLSLAGVLPKDANGNFESVTPTQLYNDLVSIQGQQTGSLSFYQFIQNEPSYQLDQVKSSHANRTKAGQLNQQLQVNQQKTLATTANNNFAKNLALLNNQLTQEDATNQIQQNLVTNPTLTAYYAKNLLPGKNLLNIGTQVTTSQYANTPSVKNTTQFPV